MMRNHIHLYLFYHHHHHHHHQVYVCLDRNIRLDPSKRTHPLFEPQRTSIKQFPQPTATTTTTTSSSSSSSSSSSQTNSSFMMSISLYKDLDRFVLNVLVKLMGAKLSENFSRKNSHLICQYQTVHTCMHTYIYI
jgi:hypothetical protein